MVFVGIVVVVVVAVVLYVVFVVVMAVSLFLLADVEVAGGFCVCEGVAWEFPVFPSPLAVFVDLLSKSLSFTERHI